MSIVLKKNAQETVIDSLLKKNNFTEARNYLQKNNQNNSINYYLLASKINLQEKFIDSSFYYLLKIDSLDLKKEQKGTFYHQLAETYAINNEEDIAFNLYQKAKQYYFDEKKIELANKMNLELYTILISQPHIEDVYQKDYQAYLSEFEETAISNNFSTQLTNAYVEKAMNSFEDGDRDKADYYIKTALESTTEKSVAARIYTIKGIYLSEVYRELDSASYYFDKALTIQKQNNDPDQLFYTYLNKAALYNQQANYDKALQYLQKADSLPIKTYVKNNKKILYQLISENLAKRGNYQEALSYLQKHIKYRDSVNIASQNINLIKSQTAKKEKQLLLSNQLKNQNRNIALGLGGGLVAVTIIGFLIFNNSRKKQRIAEQEKELEVKKTEKILKEQELTSINAMILGQEKERQRLASDLHDSVGATLAAAKLQFEHLAKNIEKPEKIGDLFDKTQKLLDDAYKEIRTMAHIKNSGVIAKNGLLPAINKLANNASGIKNLKVDVEHFGLENRIENALEITLFRIVQELVTNIIKHAQATEATIAITQHEDSINLIVEDNGVGFESKHKNLIEGMGLASIEKRIEHFEGTFEVDATKGKGTTIIIDIPL